MTTLEQERAKRIYYNQKAVAAAGASKMMKYGGMVVDVTAPKNLMSGHGIGVIAVSDDVYDQLSKDEKYNPVLAAIPDGNSFKPVGADVPTNMKKESVSIEQVNEDMPSDLFFETLENLLGDKLK